MRNLFFITSLLFFVASSCTKPCDCNDEFDLDVTYYKRDKVLYDGQCYKAVAQGRGIVPGAWLVNGNDIWEICE